METFASIIEKYGSKRRIELATENINLIKQKIGFELPNDYKEFLNKYTGFENFIGKEFVRLWDVEEVIENNVDYQIIKELNKTIGIGSNGGGEFVGIQKMLNGNCRIILSPFIDLDEEYHTEIGDSFTNFLVRLEEGIEWFK